MKRSLLLPCERFLGNFVGPVSELGQHLFHIVLASKIEHIQEGLGNTFPEGMRAFKHSRSMKQALALGHLSGPLLGDIRMILKHADEEDPDTVRLGLEVIQLQGIEAAMAMPDVSRLCTYKETFHAPKNSEVAHAAITVTCSLGIKIIEQDNGPLLNLLEQAIPNLVKAFRQGAAFNNNAALKSCDQLITKAIEQDRKDLVFKLLDTLLDVEFCSYTHPVVMVRHTANNVVKNIENLIGSRPELARYYANLVST